MIMPDWQDKFVTVEIANFRFLNTRAQKSCEIAHLLLLVCARICSASIVGAVQCWICRHLVVNPFLQVQLPGFVRYKVQEEKNYLEQRQIMTKISRRANIYSD